MADEQYRAHWNDRAAYLSVLRELQDACLREMDLVQVGAHSSRRLSGAIDAAHIAKVRYIQQCQDSSPTKPVPVKIPASKSPRPPRS